MGDIEMVYRISLDDVLLVLCVVCAMLAVLVAICMVGVIVKERVKRRQRNMSELRGVVPLVFPTLIILLSAIAGVVYLCYGDWRRGFYWLLAAGLGGCVTW